MTRAYEIAAALRKFSSWAEYGEDADEQVEMTEELCAAADLIENQQRHIDALLQANAALRDTVLRRDGQIEKMSAELADARNEIKKIYNGYDQLDASNSRLMAANEKLAADRKALINELCQYCGKYKHAHEGACDGCRWREM